MLGDVYKRQDLHQMRGRVGVANVVEKETTNGSITAVEVLFNISIAPGAILMLKASSTSV